MKVERQFRLHKDVKSDLACCLLGHSRHLYAKGGPLRAPDQPPVGHKPSSKATVCLIEKTKFTVDNIPGSTPFRISMSRISSLARKESDGISNGKHNYGMLGPLTENQ